jgi:hypothetical protein
MSLAEDFALAKQLREKLRSLEESISRRANRSPVTVEDERRMTEMQSRADASYIAAGRRAPPALPLERPEEYRRRLADGVKTYSPRWREANLESINDDALGVIETQIYADAASNGKTAGLRPTEIRPIENRSPAGHTETTFVGGENASFIKQFARPARRAVFADQAEYARMARDAQISRITQLARYGERPLVQAPRATF